MTAETSRGWAGTLGAMVLIALAALIALLAGLAILFLLPATMVIVGFNFAELWSGSGVARWIALLWFPAAFLAALYVVVSGLETMDEPSVGRLARLLLVAIVTFFAFPPFWLPA